MKILFANQALQQECNNQEILEKKYGRRLARLIRQRLDELFNARVLEQVCRLPHLRCLTVESADHGQVLAVEVDREWLILFKPAPSTRDGGRGARDWNKVSSVLILGVEAADASKKE